MKRPLHKRIISRRLRKEPSGIDLRALAKKVRYVGSREHKDRPSPAGQPRPRADASICPMTSERDFETATVWLRSALLSKRFGGAWEGDFPRYVWYRVSASEVYEARLINRSAGEYKGYPLELDQIPRGV